MQNSFNEIEITKIESRNKHNNHKMKNAKFMEFKTYCTFELNIFLFPFHTLTYY